MNVDQFKQICPQCKEPEAVCAALNEAFEKYGIDTPQRQAGFIAQTAHESAQFNKMEENLNYSAQGMANTWPGRYAVDPKAKTKVPNAKANSLHRKPEAIANDTYANRMGNGSPESGDGWRYRGGGWIMLTGKTNYEACAAATGMDCVNNPELVRTPEGAALSAGWFWTRNNCNKYCDSGDMKALTKVVNGGDIGLHERIDLYNEASNLLA